MSSFAVDTIMQAAMGFALGYCNYLSLPLSIPVSGQMLSMPAPEWIFSNCKLDKASQL